MRPDLTEEALRERIKKLEAENERLESENEELRQSKTTTTRRWLIRGGGGLAGAGLLTLLFGSASAAPSGTYPVEVDDPFTKIRVELLRFTTRTSQPSTPSSGRVVAYVDEGDLP